MNPAQQTVTLKRVAALFLQLGVTSFGSSMLPLMERALVREKKWMSTEQFADAVALAGLTPGPITLKVAGYAGYRLCGWRGGAAAVTGFIFPSLVMVMALSFFYFEDHGAHPLLKVSVLLAPVVAGLLLSTSFQLGRRFLLKPRDWAICLAAFLASVLGHPPLTVLWILGLLLALSYGVEKWFSQKISSPS